MASAAELLRRAADDPRVIGLAGGLPSAAQFPRRALGHAFLRVLARTGVPALQYGWPEGFTGLRAWVANRLRERGARIDADDVLITNGAQQAIDLALSLVTRSGSTIAVDAETYPAALDLFRARNLHPTTLGKRARVAYLMPEVGNPHGRRMTAAERTAALAKHSFVIEDDAYADLHFDGPPRPPLLALHRDRVLHVGTLSKSLSPGLRVGWLIVPRRLRKRALAAKHATDLQPSSLGQAVAEEYLAHVDFDDRLAKLRRFYRRRARLLSRALREHLPGWQFAEPEGGFAIWLQPGGAASNLAETALLARAIDEGVSFDPGSDFRASGAAHPLALRLCFSFAESDAALGEGVRRLARAFRTATRRRSR